MTPDPREDRLAQIGAMAKAMSEEIEKLGMDTGGQLVTLSEQSRVNRRLIYVTIGSVLLDLMLTAVMGVFGVQLQELTHRIDVAQTVQRQKALCPLYQVFLDSKSKAAREAAPDPVQYDHAFKVISDGYDALDCKKYISNASAR